MADSEVSHRPGPAIPLTRWADRQLRALAKLTGSDRIARLAGATIMGERAIAEGHIITGKVSAGPGTSRLMKTCDGEWFALTIPRPSDREVLPALFRNAEFDVHDDDAIAAQVAQCNCAELVEQGREVGLPVAFTNEVPASEPVSVIASGPSRRRLSGARPLVIDLSAIWAGPLTGQLFWLAGAEVVKVESKSRPDALRDFDAGFFHLINQGKSSIVVDFSNDAAMSALIDLIRRADIVIESSRPRALLQLGIDADALVRETPGLVWLSITGHGATGEAANWVGIGHECGVAGGLSRALEQVTGEVGFVGDAIADPLTGIIAAVEGWRAYRDGRACRIGFALSAIAAKALAEERAADPAALDDELRAWGAATGQPFPAIEQRKIEAAVSPFGADTRKWLGNLEQC